MKPSKPLLLDLCCGLGGWSGGFLSAGWRCVGVDLGDFSESYPGEFVQADLMTWDGWRKLSPVLVVASPPCEEFSRWGMPWTRARNPPLPSLALVERCREIAEALDCPIILENVRAAQGWLGRSAMNCGAFHLWGDVPALIPNITERKKESFDSKRRAERAKIPFALSAHIARAFSPANLVSV